MNKLKMGPVEEDFMDGEFGELSVEGDFEDGDYVEFQGKGTYQGGKLVVDKLNVTGAVVEDEPEPEEETPGKMSVNKIMEAE